MREWGREREDKVKRVRERENIKSAVFLYPLNFYEFLGLVNIILLDFSPRQKFLILLLFKEVYWVLFMFK